MLLLSLHFPCIFPSQENVQKLLLRRFGDYSGGSMSNRFIILTLLTGLFQIICAIALVLGLITMFHNSNGDPNDPFSQIPALMRVAGGAIYAFFGLNGLVFSGGINVLISIDENTHSLNQKLPSALLDLQKTLALLSQTVRTKDERTIGTAASNASSGTKTNCENCGSANDLGNRFCEACGSNLTRS